MPLVHQSQQRKCPEKWGKADICKKYWKSVYNRCASLIYTIWLWYNIVEISQHILRSHKMYWDLTRCTEISQDLLGSHKIYWDLTRSADLAKCISHFQYGFVQPPCVTHCSTLLHCVIHSACRLWKLVVSWFWFTAIIFSMPCSPSLCYTARERWELSRLGSNKPLPSADIL